MWSFLRYALITGVASPGGAPNNTRRKAKFVLKNASDFRDVSQSGHKKTTVTTVMVV